MTDNEKTLFGVRFGVLLSVVIIAPSFVSVLLLLDERKEQHGEDTTDDGEREDSAEWDDQDPAAVLAEEIHDRVSLTRWIPLTGGDTDDSDDEFGECEGEDQEARYGE